MTGPSLLRSRLRRAMGRLRSRVRGVSERDLDDELRAYVEARVQRHEQAGLPPAEARRAALIDVGGLDQVKEATRSVQPWHEAELFWRDIRFGARCLRRSPGYAGVVLATLALGVGTSVAMFSIMHAVMWRPLPYPAGDRLVVIGAGFGPVRDAGLAPGEVLAIRASSRAFNHVGVARGVDAFITTDDQMERVAAASVTNDVLPLLVGGPLQLGRPLESSVDMDSDRVKAVVISDRLWRRVFHGDRAVVGRHLEVNNIDVEVVGVLPAGLRTWLPASTGVHEQTDIWFPSALEANWQSRGPEALARLAPGVTLTAARVELDRFKTQFLNEQPAVYANAVGPLDLDARSLREVIAAPVRRGLIGLSLSVGFVLLIGCVNIANLMLARGKAREREMNVRLALGASHQRIIRQLLTEHLVLAVGGAAIGLVIAQNAVSWFGWLRPDHLPRQSSVAIDATAAAVAIGLSICAVLVCGLIPAVRLANRRSAGAISARSTVSAPGGRRLQRTLVVAEVALSIAPLFAAGLMLQTFVNQTQAPLGFDPSGVLTAKVGLSFSRHRDVASRVGVYDDVLAAVRHLPGVEAVSGGSPLPFEPTAVYRFRREHEPTAPGFAATQQTVLPGYLTVTRTPIIRGRDFTADDISARREVAIVDERFAETFFGGEALGQRFLRGTGRQQRLFEVIGVTRHVRVTRVLDAARTSVRDEAMPHVFIPFHVNPVAMALVIRTRGETPELGPAVKRAVEALGSTRAVYDVQPMNTYVSQSLDDSRLAMIVLTAFAAASLLLAAIGLYGTLAYLIARRTPEFGLRVALGASTGRIVGLVAVEGALLTAAGATLGIGGAFVVARALRGQLYGVAALDLPTLAAVAAVVAAMALVAVSHPAWRAARVDPNIVLKAE